MKNVARLLFVTVVAAIALRGLSTPARAQWLPLSVKQVGLVGATATYNLDWLPDPNCLTCGAYDVFLGDLNVLRTPATAGNFNAASLGCMNDNWAVPPPITGLAVPAAGVGYFYLVRAQSTALAGPCFSWEADWMVSFNRQCEPRDQEINGAPGASPCP